MGQNFIFLDYINLCETIIEKCLVCGSYIFWKVKVIVHRIQSTTSFWQIGKCWLNWTNWQIAWIWCNNTTIFAYKLKASHLFEFITNCRKLRWRALWRSLERVLYEMVQKIRVSTSEPLESLRELLLRCLTSFCTISRVCESTKCICIFIKWGFVIKIYTLLIVSKIIILSFLYWCKHYCRTTLNSYVLYFFEYLVRIDSIFTHKWH